MTRCAALGCPDPAELSLHVGTVAGFTLSAPICKHHAADILEMRKRLPNGLRDWAGTIEPFASLDRER